MENFGISSFVGVSKDVDLVQSVLLASALVILWAFIKTRLGKTDKEKKTNGKFSVASLPGPKPFPLPIIGNSLQLLPLSKSLSTIAKWAQTYGPCYQTVIAGQRFVWVNSPEMLKELLKSSQPGHIKKSPVIYDHFKIFVENGIIVSQGDTWKSHRKILMRSMSYQSLRAYIPLLNKHSRRLINRLDELYGDGQPHGIKLVVNISLFEVICELVTGADVHNTEDGTLCHHYMMLLEEIMIHRLLHPWLLNEFIWNWHPMTKDVELLLENQKMTRAKEAIEKEKNGDKTQEPVDVPKFRSVIDELLDDNMPDNDIVDELLVVLTAGHETTATSIHFFTFLLALHPEHQEKCRQEIDLAFGDSTNSGCGELTYEDLISLKYLEACAQESLRIYPPAFLVARQLDTPLRLDDNIELPPGTDVMISPWCIHRNPAYFTDPETFDPSRWTPEEVAKRHPYTYIPFSAGPRNCMGFKFAMMEMKMTIAYMLHEFLITTTDKINDVSLFPNVLLTPERDFNLTFKRRS